MQRSSSRNDGASTIPLHLTEEGDVAEAVFEAARHRDWTLRELRRDDKTLEQVFRELTATSEVAA